jgi:hypothetical protein
MSWLRGLFRRRGNVIAVSTAWVENPTGRLLVVHVVNNGDNAVEIAEAGFLLSDGQKLCFTSGLKGGGFLPHLLMKGTSFAVPMISLADDYPSLREARCAYVKTVGGDTITGTTGVREVAAELP